MLSWRWPVLQIIALLDLSAEMHGIASGLFAFCKELQSLADLRESLGPECPNLVQKSWDIYAFRIQKDIRHKMAFGLRKFQPSMKQTCPVVHIARVIEQCCFNSTQDPLNVQTAKFILKPSKVIKSKTYV